MTIDEAEKLARDHADSCADTGNRGCIGDDLARFLLRVLPVVRAAEAFSKVYHQHPLNQDVIDLVRAVDAMRSEP